MIQVLWAIVAFAAVVLAYRVAMRWVDRPYALFFRVNELDTQLRTLRQEMAERIAAEKAAGAAELAKLEDRVLTVEQRTDPGLARRR